MYHDIRKTCFGIIYFTDAGIKPVIKERWLLFYYKYYVFVDFLLLQVLVCVHAVICTDKSPQARRAAVTVLRQLFLGLESEMIAFLKEDILPIYRSLKEIYHTDKDDVMRLQAQLALEELNENMKAFVLPMPQLPTEKKIIMLN